MGECVCFSEWKLQSLCWLWWMVQHLKAVVHLPGSGRKLGSAQGPRNSLQTEERCSRTQPSWIVEACCPSNVNISRNLLARRNIVSTASQIILHGYQTHILNPEYLQDNNRGGPWHFNHVSERSKQHDTHYYNLRRWWANKSLLQRWTRSRK